MYTACNKNLQRYSRSRVHVLWGTQRSGYPHHTYIPELSRARGQHRCAPGQVDGLAEAHTGSKKSDIACGDIPAGIYIA